MAQNDDSLAPAEEVEVLRLCDAPDGGAETGINFRDLVQTESYKTPDVEFVLPSSALSCADDDMTLHVQPELCQKIWLSQYVNLNSLLKKEQSSTASLLSLNEQGVLEVKQKTAKSVTNIRDWTDAFLIFTAIFIKKHPSMASELLEYMSIIREAESRSSGSFAWRLYDENFRMRQAVKPQSWAKINPDLWLRTMTNAGNATPDLRLSSYNRRPTGLCLDYNNKGCFFRSCKYTHRCTACKGDHPEPKCPRSFKSFRGPPGNSFPSQRGSWRNKTR
ncbi:MAG: hypothetical protein ABW185_24190 [Sedimenticola sp.]